MKTMKTIKANAKTYQYLVVEVQKNVAFVQLNNPRKANAINKTMWFELGEAFTLLDQDEEVSCCIITGNGRHFTSGIDIGFLSDIMKETKLLPPDQRQNHLYQTIREMQQAFSAIQNCKKPVMAAIHGVCIGGGVDLIAACDFRFATKLSVFSIMETRLGIVADVGTLQRLRFTVPEGRFRELAFTSKLFRGYQAEKWGIVNRSYITKRQMMAAVNDLAQTICSLPAYAVQGTKETLNFSREQTVEQGLEAVARLNSGLFLSAEAEKTFLGLGKKV